MDSPQEVDTTPEPAEPWNHSLRPSSPVDILPPAVPTAEQCAASIEHAVSEPEPPAPSIQTPPRRYPPA